MPQTASPFASRLDDSVKLLLIVMSILYSTALTLELKFNPGSPADYIMFGFPILSVIPFAVGNLFSGAIERNFKALSIYFLIFSLGFFPLAILSSVSPPLITAFWYALSGFSLATLSFFSSIMSVIYTQGNWNYIGTRWGGNMLIVVSVVTATVMYVALGTISVIV